MFWSPAQIFTEYSDALHLLEPLLGGGKIPLFQNLSTCLIIPLSTDAKFPISAPFFIYLKRFWQFPTSVSLQPNATSE